MDKKTSSLLSWSLANSGNANEDSNASQTQTDRPLKIDQETLRSLMGGPSDADLMKQSMSAIVSEDVPLEQKIIAFDNFEQLVEQLDNANNIQPLGLWPALKSQLSSSEQDLRRMSAWCIGTAVQNNEKSQQHALQQGVIEPIAKMCIEENDVATRRKACYALSSLVRNCQPNMDEASRYLPSNITGPDAVNANDMDVLDAIMSKLREQ
ncbi:hypothetical protein BT93_L0754 [Corymbia citriodora subsp. variegata]|uniref:Nucleotide exchange factor Fes1 domain-containing protein n=1 Tax=Corymbia citriodora subsp. variegata TaxID=360336 RepID=A0A8T0CII1_CORYI|nr:hypothetical protein BT93_L0754 [Corymbia citriodora subsp. variegata]